MLYFFRIRDAERLAQPFERRVAVFFLILAIHIGLIFLLISSRPVLPQQKPKGSLSTFALAASQQASTVAKANKILQQEQEPISPSMSEIFAEQQLAQGDPDGVACSPVDVIATKLALDPNVPLAIARVPNDERSISEAIVMWNTVWSSAAIPDEAPMADVRQLILGILADLPPDCLATPVTGPRLIPISDTEGRTTFLAFGSGEWTWQQLMEPPADRQPEDANIWTWKDIFPGEGSPVF